VFNKKVMTALNEKSTQGPDRHNSYVTCMEDVGDIDQNVGYMRAHFFLDIFTLTDFSPST
jgi:hypothetical protein